MVKGGKCKHCGEDFKNLGAHLRYCKVKKAQEEQDESHTEAHTEDILTEAIQTPQEGEELPREATAEALAEKEPEQPKKKGKRFKIFNRSPKEPDQTKNPVKMDLDKLDLHEVPGETEEEKIKNFFAGLPKWTAKRPKGLKGRLFKLFNGDKALKPCVFVSEHEPPKICYVPWDPKREVMVNPNTGEIYEPPTKGDIAFFHRDKFRPLVGSRDPSDMYDLPEHYALKLYNMGLQEAQLKGFDDLISHIKKTQLIAWGCLGLSCIILIGAVIMIKSNATATQAAISAMNNVTSMYGGV